MRSKKKPDELKKKSGGGEGGEFPWKFAVELSKGKKKMVHPLREGGGNVVWREQKKTKNKKPKPQKTQTTQRREVKN